MTVWQLSNSSHLMSATEPCAWSCCIWCECSRLYGTKYDLVSKLACGEPAGKKRKTRLWLVRFKCFGR